MSDPAQEIVESIAVLMLQAQAGLSGVTVTNQNTDDENGADRIVCKASPREVEVLGLNRGAPKIFRIPLEISVRLSERDADKFGTWIASVEAAFANGASIPAAAVTLAGTLSPSMVRFEDTDDGNYENTSNVRGWTKVYVCLFQPSAG